MAELDSALQIGLFTYWEYFLIVVGGLSSLDLKNSEIGHISIYISTTRGAMVKRTADLNSAHRIGLSTCIEDVLIVVKGSSSLDFKKQRNWSRFNLYLHN